MLRRDLASRTTPVVLVTSDTIAKNLARGSGATSVMVKPCLPEALLTEVVRLLELSRTTAGRAAAELAEGPAPPAGEHSPQRSRRSMSRSHLRGETDLPPASPPDLICPVCDRPLDYKSSQVGGVSVRNAEQWDYFVCGTGCGTFQYRQRTRKVRNVQPG